MRQSFFQQSGPDRQFPLFSFRFFFKRLSLKWKIVSQTLIFHHVLQTQVFPGHGLPLRSSCRFTWRKSATSWLRTSTNFGAWTRSSWAGPTARWGARRLGRKRVPRSLWRDERRCRAIFFLTFFFFLVFFFSSPSVSFNLEDDAWNAFACLHLFALNGIIQSLSVILLSLL